MVIGWGCYGLLAIFFGLCPQLWHESWFATGYLLLNPGVLAMGSVGYLSLSMRLSWTRAAATMFTIYMTVSNVGHVLGNYLVGWLREGIELSYEKSFWVAGVAMLLPLFLLPLVKPEQVDQMRS